MNLTKATNMQKRKIVVTEKKKLPIRRVPTGDFPIMEEEKQAINDVLTSGRISEWKKVREFEIEFAR